MKYWITFFLLIALVFIASDSAEAQCAMCKLNAENATENVDENIGKGLNAGILYLMGIPYGLLLIGALVFFRKKIFNFMS